MFKSLEWIGAIIAALGFMMLAQNLLGAGFAFGLLSCGILIPYLFIERKIALGLLQIFFLFANIVGLLNNV